MANKFETTLKEFDAVQPAPGGYVPLASIVKFSNPQVVQEVIAVAQLAANQTGATALTVYIDDLDSAVQDAVAAETVSKNARLILERILESARELHIEDLTFDTDLNV